MSDAEWLARAVALASGSASGSGGPFGSVIVRAGVVLGEGANEVTETDDPTAHAEIVAIRRACLSLGTHDLAGAVLYASCEPCPMCLAASLWARVDRIAYAADRGDAARAGFADEEFYELFSTPRAQWTTLRISQVALPGAADPFEQWLANQERERY